MINKIYTPLDKGDTIAIVAPAGLVQSEYIELAKGLFESWGLCVKLGKNLFKAYNTFAGTDNERLQDFQEAIDDKNIKAIFCARGGYGSIRIIDKVKWNNFIKHPKWIIGFSDITIFHSKLAILGYHSLHAPMPVNLSKKEDFASSWWRSLQNILFGKTSSISINASDFNNPGKANGVLTGGNLSILYSLLGTPLDTSWENKILFIEDLDEHLYHLDRIMNSLKLSGKLENLNGLLVGHFTNMKDNKRPFGKTYEEIILDAVRTYNYPVIFNVPIGHEKENYPLVFGKSISIDTCKLELQF